MVSPNDSNHYTATNFKNVSPLGKSNYHTERTPERPYNINENYFLHIDHSVPFDLDQIYFTPHITEDGIYFKVHKDLKNKAAGSSSQANPADHSEDSSPDYQHEYV